MRIETERLMGKIPDGSDPPYPFRVGTLEWTGHMHAMI